MEGRGWNWKAIAEGLPEPRNPGEDNPLRWPTRYIDRLLRGSMHQRAVRSNFRVERAALFAWMRGTRRLPQPPEGFLKENARWTPEPSFALITEVWAGLTHDWARSGTPAMIREQASFTEHPVTVPETLRWLPQAVLAWDEWLSGPCRVEELDESTVRQHVTEVLRPPLHRR